MKCPSKLIVFVSPFFLFEDTFKIKLDLAYTLSLEGDVLEIDDDSSAVAQAEPPSQPGKGEDSEVIEID